MKDNGVIRFSYNWNNKLNCKSFTTLRRYNPKKYAVGMIHQVMLKTRDGWVTDYNNAVIVDTRGLSLGQISGNEFICRLDTGYSAEETVKMLMKMYKGINLETMFSLVLYRYIKS